MPSPTGSDLNFEHLAYSWMFYHKRKQCQVSGPLYSECELPLVPGASARLSPRSDFTTFRQITPQNIRLLVVNF